MTARTSSTSGMALVDGIDALDRSLGRLFFVVGVFDGLHRGHEDLLRSLARVAEEHAARPAVITFDHHPDEVLTGKAPPLLCDAGERLERLAAAGVAVTVVQPFDVALRETPFDVFIRRIAARVELAGFLMTPESAFGFERRGTPDAIAALGRELGFEVAVVPQLSLDGAPVRSTDIRAAIASGDLARARNLLGRDLSYTGVLERQSEGSLKLNLELPMALPPPGRYDVWVSVSGERRTAEAAIDPSSLTLFDGDLTSGGRASIAIIGLASS
jgi:riboflavin kinase / FMN adenylyltransferase